MSTRGCTHLQAFKKIPKNVRTIKWVHDVFCVESSTRKRRAKVVNASCRECRIRMPFIHACVNCVYFGCHKHIREHTRNRQHGFAIDLTYGQLYCQGCGDYVYDSEIDELFLQNKMQCRKFRKRLFEWTQWNPTEEERELLTHRTKKICISPESTIGLRGLINLGFTCYMNCIVQVLMHTPLLRDYFLTERHICKGVLSTCMVCEVSKLFQEFYNGVRVPLFLNDLLHLTWSHASHLAGCAQQDAHEFFIAILDILHTHFKAMMPLNVKVENGGECQCFIDQIFTGMLQSDVVCQKCKNVSTKIDPLLDFSLDVPLSESETPCTLVECLERFTRAEHLGTKENEKIKCENCESYEESTKQLTMKMLPVIISVHFKRFEHSLQKKISTVIKFPEMLDMSPFLSKNRNNTAFPRDNRYSLFAVINHWGTTLNGGHYTAFVRQQHDCWYKCDDHVITRASLKDVLDSEGYLLFYHKHVLGYK